jgi:putative endonuclease
MGIGQLGEGLVADLYLNSGHRVIGRNVRLHASKQIGELDVIVTKGKEIIFIEVKTRKSKAFGNPADAIGYLKRRRLVNACQVFLLRHPQYDGWNWRIDVAEVYLDKPRNSIIILENAIEDH